MRAAEDVSVGLDIGGSLAKAAILVPPGEALEACSGAAEGVRDGLALDLGARGSLVFLALPTSEASLASLLGPGGVCSHARALGLTGGGASRARALLGEANEARAEMVDEMGALPRGLGLLQSLETSQPGLAFRVAGEPRTGGYLGLFPYLLVNVGTGTSFVLVEGPQTSRRVGGSCVGGGVFLGLGRLLTREQRDRTDFDGLLGLAAEGDPDEADMLVRDIYGAGYEAAGLDGGLLAGSFGRCDESTATDDALAALQRMLCLTLAQLASLYAARHGCRQAVFSGGFLEGGDAVQDLLSTAMDYWSGGSVPATFLRHSKFLGAIGALGDAGLE